MHMEVSYPSLGFFPFIQLWLYPVKNDLHLKTVMKMNVMSILTSQICLLCAFFLSILH